MQIERTWANLLRTSSTIQRRAWTHNSSDANSAMEVAATSSGTEHRKSIARSSKSARLTVPPSRALAINASTATFDCSRLRFLVDCRSVSFFSSVLATASRTLISFFMPSTSMWLWSRFRAFCHAPSSVKSTKAMPRNSLVFLFRTIRTSYLAPQSAKCASICSCVAAYLSVRSGVSTQPGSALEDAATTASRRTHGI
eukprot:SAG11_NODE_740_length_7421_cov_6.264818_8_plen_198_part_00